MADNAKVKLNCVLDGESAFDFVAIKEAKGLKNNTEVVRLIVTEFYKKILLKEAQEA